MTSSPTTASAGALLRQRQAENFPVALRVLPAALRQDLEAVYDVVRVIDDLGDEAPGDRLALLDSFAEDQHRAFEGGQPQWDVLRRLVPTIRRRNLSEQPLLQLIEANRVDQHTCRYDSFDDLVGYCRLSAVPIGRLVLRIFGHAEPELAALSDDVCIALQILEHCQDVAEDYRRGRIYLPQQDLASFGVRPEELAGRSASPQLRALINHQVDRCEQLLDSGDRLVGSAARLGPAGDRRLRGRRPGDRDGIAAQRRGRAEHGAEAEPRPYRLVRGAHPGAPKPPAEPMNAQLTDAFAATESITRSQARNFYYGIRLLPRAKRTALCAVYALARRIDDIGDGDRSPAEQKLQRLTELSARLDSIDNATDSGDPVLVAVAEVSRHFPIPLGAFQELIQGVQLDVRGARYETFDELTQYCRFVAGSIGRLCLGVFGSDGTDPAAATYADSLGIGLQQTNILRDIREDLLAGRVYLPAQDLDRFGVRLRIADDGRLADDDGRLTELIRFSAERATDWYQRRSAPAAAAGLAQPEQLRRDGRHLSAAAGPDRVRAGPGLRRPAQPVRRRQGPDRRTSPAGRAGHPSSGERVSAGRVAVIGGGLAGITAALRLADAGRPVLLLEAGAKLGGLTHSFQRGELHVDNGQHVFLRCCQAYLRLLDRLGVREQVTLQPRLDVAVRAPDEGRPARLSRTGLPAPLHLGSSLLRYRMLSPADRLRAVAGALAMRRLPGADPALDSVNFGEWLDEHGQNSRTVAALWDVFTVATLNLPAAAASLAMAAKVFQTGLLTDAAAGDIGWSLVPLQQLHGEPAVRALEGAGGRDPHPQPGHRADPGRHRLDGPRPGRPDRAGRAGGARRAAGPGRAIAAGGQPEPAGRLGAAAGQLADRQRAPGAGSTGAGRGLRCRGALAGAVDLRPHRAVRPGPAAEPRPVPGDLAVGRRRADRQPHGRSPRLGAARAGPVAARVPAGRGSRLLRQPGTARHLPGHARQRLTATTGRHVACPGWPWPARGRPPAGRPRWRARCSAAKPPPSC